MPFSAHNIRLNDGSETFPEIGWLIADSPWLHSAQKIIGQLFPDGPEGHSIVDLGCLEGGYTVEFARMGMDATGIEVRQTNFDNCKIVSDGVSLPNLHFHKDDVWNLSKYGQFDVIFCCGLLYHLEDVKSFIKLMGQCARRAVIINTHISFEDGEATQNLGELTEHQGMRGRWYREYDPAIMNKTDLERAILTSWNNNRSFWPTQTALLQALYDVGFDLVAEQVDWLAPDFYAFQGDVYKSGRRMFFGVRTKAA